MIDSVLEQLNATAGELHRWATSEGVKRLEEAADLIAGALLKGGKLLLCGNGGSAADCQHVAAEFVCRLSASRPRGPMAALALTTDTSFITACSNDYSFDLVFARQVRGLGRPGDVLMAISTSGSSRNVVLAAEEAKKIGIPVVSLTGPGGQLPRIADVAIMVDSSDTAVIQNVHLALEHALCRMVEEMVVQGGFFDEPRA
ncbi:MAG: SIS domain-containing protein [Thermanaerothrix sp.]|nr:SIS domain-containing protein [Thermanaerothrix sp.]